MSAPTLVEFLEARIAEDEVLASATPSDEWGGVDAWGPGATDFYYTDSGAQRWPPRVLAECDAKRQIIDFAFEDLEIEDGEWGCGHSAAEIRAGKCRTIRPAEAGILQALALPYSDHPDYDPAWRIS